MTIVSPNLKETFYKNIATFKDFSAVLNDSHYVQVPDDWFIVLTDVRGSTNAIKQGRYKQVNMIGAASITAVLNCLGNLDIPFVFGGDGATLLIPPESVNAVISQMKSLQRFSLDEFKLELRVGLVSLRTLRDQNANLKVAKYELSAGNCLAQFRGGALTRAEDLVKKKLEGADIIEPKLIEPAPNLDGLSCRINPLKSVKGVIVSLICKSREGEKSEFILQDILNRIKFILGDDFKLASPVNSKNMDWDLIPPTFRSEIQMSKKGSSFFVTFFRVLFRVLLANLSIKFGFPLGPFRPEKYKSEVIINTDFKKFDETLRMVVDCTIEQAIVLENLLKSNFESKRIFYGLHKSSEAIITCMVFSASQNQHIHFIDGAQGGYAFAALELKKQDLRLWS